jgi:hypothetical protein
VGLSFRWDAFDIEKMVEKKMASTSFGGVVSHWEPALAMALPPQGHLALGLLDPCAG